MFPQHKWLILVSLAAVLALFVFAGCGKKAEEGQSPQKLVVNVIDIGQGDAILIRVSGQVALIDSGDVPARDQLVSYIKKQGVSVIDHLVITHPHSDHLGGAAAILGNFTVKHVYDSGQPSASPLFRAYVSTVEKKGIAFTVLAAGDRIDMGGGAVLTVFAPGKPPVSGTESDTNNNSVVVRLSYGEFSLLLPGDSEQEAEARLVSRFGGDLRSKVLKSGHHGSRTSSSPAFLGAVSPEAVVISAGAGNEYHHPHPSTLKKYGERNMKVFRTDTDGTVTILSDGKTYTITREKH